MKRETALQMAQLSGLGLASLEVGASLEQQEWTAVPGASGTEPRVWKGMNKAVQRNQAKRKSMWRRGERIEGRIRGSMGVCER